MSMGMQECKVSKLTSILATLPPNADVHLSDCGWLEIWGADGLCMHLLRLEGDDTVLEPPDGE